MDSFTGDFERRENEAFVNGASLPVGVLGAKIGGRASVIGNLQAT